MEKTFDRLDWLYLEHTLERMGFLTDLISWVEVLYSGPQSRVRVDGYMSEQFKLKLGTRQLAVLYPLYYIGTKPLAEMMRENPKNAGNSSR